jgi:hypothetical protein
MLLFSYKAVQEMAHLSTAKQWRHQTRKLRQDLENNGYIDADDADRTRAPALHGAGHALIVAATQPANIRNGAHFK